MDINSMLKPGSLLRGGSYRVEAPIGSGGFGNTYRVRHTSFNEVYAMKEFFMRGVNQRQPSGSVTVSVQDNIASYNEQKAKFRKEAQRLRSLDNPHIVKVHDMFEDNNTVYYVMDFIDGQSVGERMKATGQPLSEGEVRRILPQLLSALNAVHAQQIWHLDIKPGNIMVDRQGRAYLIDFGASKQLKAGGGQTSSALCYTPGFAPMEQVAQESDNFGPWTDFYALGATLYNMLTLLPPPSSGMILEGTGAFSYPPTVSLQMQQLIGWMMQLKRQDRPQQVADIEQRLGIGDGPSTVLSRPQAKSSKKSAWLAILSVLVVVLLGVGAYFLFFNGDSKNRSHSNDYYEDDSYEAQESLDELDDIAVGEPQSDKLAQVAEAANRNCPISLGEFGTATSITYDSYDNAIVYTYDVNEEYVDVDGMSKNQALMKSNALTMISNPDDNMRTLMEMIVEENGRLRYVYNGIGSGATASATFTTRELNEALNTYVSPVDKVESAIASANLQMPMRVDEITVLTGMKLMGSNVTYLYDIDESDGITIPLLKQNKAQVKQNLNDVVYNSNDPIQQNLLKMIIDANLNLAYRYHGTTSGETLEVVFTISELKAHR